jgi:transcription antitermination protein NusB
MKNPRRRAREFALQALYQWQVAAQEVGDIETQYAEMEGYAKADATLFTKLVRGVIKEQAVLIERLTPHLDRPWPELSPVERAVMLASAFELIHMVETPYRVIINEAIELAKSFGGTDGHKYVNGVLDKLAATVRADEIQYQAANPTAQKPRKSSTATVTVKAKRTVKP